MKNAIPGHGGEQTFFGTTPIILTTRNPARVNNNWPGDWWYFQEHLPHELGHALGLCHTHNRTFCAESIDINNLDYLSDVFRCFLFCDSNTRQSA
jgi:phage terminase large subunit-like protein